MSGPSSSDAGQGRPGGGREAFRRGLIASLPFTVMILPFGAVFGVIAAGMGIALSGAMGFSVVVIAGASQFAALQLIGEGAPVMVVILTALAVNMRMAMYSVAMTPHFGKAPLWVRALVSYCLIDQSYVLASAEFTRYPDQSLGQKLGYYFGVALPLCVLWLIATWFGVSFGRLLPEGIALDFVVPLTFLAMIAPILLTPAQIAAAGVSVAATLALWWMPWSTGLLVAAVLAMATGALIETWQQRRAGGQNG